MSQADVIDLTGDSDEEAEQAEIGGASSVVFCVFLRSHRLLASASARSNLAISPRGIFKRPSFPACLHSFWFTSRPNARAQREREKTTQRVYGDVTRD